jgi:hypothetical protein
LHSNHAIGSINNPKVALGGTAGGQQVNDGAGEEIEGVKSWHDYYYTAI